MKWTIQGVTDEVTSCDCCGRQDLKRTVSLIETDTGREVFFGTECAAKALELPAADVRKQSRKAQDARQRKADAARRRKHDEEFAHGQRHAGGRGGADDRSPGRTVGRSREVPAREAIMKTRDNGREASYRAEREAFHGNRVQLNQAEVLSAVAEVHRLHGDGGTLPRVRFQANRHATATALPFLRQIKFPGAGVSIQLVLHELAHIYTPGFHHGPEWRRKYLELVQAMMGPVDAMTLAQAFIKHGVSAHRVGPDPLIRGPRRAFRLEVRRVITQVARPSGSQLISIVRQEVTDWEPAGADVPACASTRAKMRLGWIISRTVADDQVIELRMVPIRESAAAAGETC